MQILNLYRSRKLVAMKGVTQVAPPKRKKDGVVVSVYCHLGW